MKTNYIKYTLHYYEIYYTYKNIKFNFFLMKTRLITSIKAKLYFIRAQTWIFLLLFRLCSFWYRPRQAEVRHRNSSPPLLSVIYFNHNDSVFARGKAPIRHILTLADKHKRIIILFEIWDEIQEQGIAIKKNKYKIIFGGQIKKVANSCVAPQRQLKITYRNRDFFSN